MRSPGTGIAAEGMLLSNDALIQISYTGDCGASLGVPLPEVEAL